MVNTSQPCIRLSDIKTSNLLQAVNSPTKGAGTIMEILEILMNYLGRCYEWVTPADDRFGSLLPNGSWDGVIGLLLNGDADIGVFLGITMERARVVDFTEPVFGQEFAVSYKFPELQSDIIGFIKPFSPALWLVMFMTSLLVFGATWLMLESYSCGFKRDESEAREREQSKKNSKSVERSLLWTMCSIISQPVPWEPVTFSLRVLGGLWLLMAFILGVVYRGNLKAMLILPKLELPFNNFKELDESGLRVWSPGSPIAHQMLLSAPPDSVYGSIGRKSFTHMRFREGIEATIRGEHAALTAYSPFKEIMDSYFDRTGKCVAYKMQERFSVAQYAALALPKGSKLKPKLDKAIRALKEFGIIEHIRDIRSNGTICMKPPKLLVTEGQLRPLDIGDFLGVLSIYAAGMFLSICVFVMELAIGRNKPQNDRP